MRTPRPKAARGRLVREQAQSPLEAILENSEDAIIVKRLDNTVTVWSPGAERLYGYPRREMVGQSITRLLPPDRPGEAEDIIRRIAEGERVVQRETVRRTRDGRLLNVSLSVTPLRDRAGRIIGAVTVTRDLTESRRTEAVVHSLEAEARSRALLLETAGRVALDILASQTGAEALQHIAEAARRLAGARYAALGVARPDGQGLAEFIPVGMTPEQEAAIGAAPQGLGILGRLLLRTTPLRIERVTSHAGSVGFPPNHPPMDSFLGVPIRRGDTALGSLYLTDKEDGGGFTEADEAAVAALGAHAAVAIYHLQMLSRQRALTRGLISAQEEERRSVAYDLHDGLTQFVMAAHAHMEAFQRAQAGGSAERAARELEQGLRYLKESVVESRRLVNGLRSLALDDLGLAGALELLLGEEKARAGWQDAEFLHNIAGQRFDTTLETAVYRVAQEALTNVRKHAGAARVAVRLLWDEAALTLDVQDWGRGFVSEERGDSQGRVGLTSMAERAHLMGGTYHLHSVPGAGATVHAVFPAPPLRAETGGP